MTAREGASTPLPLLTLEARILIQAARPGGTAEELRPLVEAGPSWGRLVQLSSEQKLLPVLWKAVEPIVEGSDDPQIQSLRRMGAISDFHMEGAREALLETLEALSDAGIDAMLLKGAALASTVYERFGDRPMVDLDLLLLRDESRRGWDALRERGWRAAYGEESEFWEEMHHLPPLVTAGDRPTAVEIHRGLLRPGPFSIDHDRIWRDGETVELDGITARVPSPGDQLLHLSIHLGWSDMLTDGLLRTARDVAQLLDAVSMDWPRFLEVARASRAATCAYWTLRLSRSLAGASAPDDAIRALRPPGSARWLGTLERIYVASALDHACPSIRVGRWLWDAGIRPIPSGHGEARPWHDSERWKSLMHGGAAGSGIVQRVRHHAKHARDWVRFIAIALAPRRRSRS